MPTIRAVFGCLITIRPEGLSKVFIEFQEVLIVEGNGWRLLEGETKMVCLGNLEQVIEFAQAIFY